MDYIITKWLGVFFCMALGMCMGLMKEWTAFSIAILGEFYFLWVF